MKTVRFILALSMLLPLFTQVVSAHGSTVISSGQYVASGKDENVVVDIMLDGGVNVGAYDYTLSYDPTILEFVSVEKGDFLGDGVRNSDSSKSKDGIVVAGAYSMGTSDSGSGILDKFTFKAIKPGSKSEIKISDAQLTSASVESEITEVDTESGSVVVGGSQGFWTSFTSWLESIISSLTN